MQALPPTTASILQSSEDILSTLHRALEVRPALCYLSADVVTLVLINDRFNGNRNNELLSMKPIADLPS